MGLDMTKTAQYQNFQSAIDSAKEEIQGEGLQWIEPTIKENPTGLLCATWSCGKNSYNTRLEVHQGSHLEGWYDVHLWTRSRSRDWVEDWSPWLIPTMRHIIHAYRSFLESSNL